MMSAELPAVQLDRQICSLQDRIAVLGPLISESGYLSPEIPPLSLIEDIQCELSTRCQQVLGLIQEQDSFRELLSKIRASSDDQVDNEVEFFRGALVMQGRLLEAQKLFSSLMVEMYATELRRERPVEFVHEASPLQERPALVQENVSRGDVGELVCKLQRQNSALAGELSALLAKHSQWESAHDALTQQAYERAGGRAVSVDEEEMIRLADALKAAEAELIKKQQELAWLREEKARSSERCAALESSQKEQVPIEAYNAIVHELNEYSSFLASMTEGREDSAELKISLAETERRLAEASLREDGYRAALSASSAKAMFQRQHKALVERLRALNAETVELRAALAATKAENEWNEAHGALSTEMDILRATNARLRQQLNDAKEGSLPVAVVSPSPNRAPPSTALSTCSSCAKLGAQLETATEESQMWARKFNDLDVAYKTLQDEIMQLKEQVKTKLSQGVEEKLALESELELLKTQVRSKLKKMAEQKTALQNEVARLKRLDSMVVDDDVKRKRAHFLSLAPMLGLVVKNSPHGIMVTKVRYGMSARAAGLLVDDVVVKIGDEVITSTAVFDKVTTHAIPGDTVDFVVRRDGQELTKSIRYGGTGIGEDALGELRAIVGEAWIAEHYQRLVAH